MCVEDFAAWLKQRQALKQSHPVEFKSELTRMHQTPLIPRLVPCRYRKDWIIIKGYDRNISDLLTVTLDVHEEILEVGTQHVTSTM